MLSLSRLGLTDAANPPDLLSTVSRIDSSWTVSTETFDRFFEIEVDYRLRPLSTKITNAWLDSFFKAHSYLLENSESYRNKVDAASYKPNKYSIQSRISEWVTSVSRKSGLERTFTAKAPSLTLEEALATPRVGPFQFGYWAFGILSETARYMEAEELPTLFEWALRDPSPKTLEIIADVLQIKTFIVVDRSYSVDAGCKTVFTDLTPVLNQYDWNRLPCPRLHDLILFCNVLSKVNKAVNSNLIHHVSVNIRDLPDNFRAQKCVLKRFKNDLRTIQSAYGLTETTEPTTEPYETILLDGNTVISSSPLNSFCSGPSGRVGLPGGISLAVTMTTDHQELRKLTVGTNRFMVRL